MSQAQLRDCEDLKATLRSSNDATLASKKQLEADRAAIDQAAADLQADQAALDRTSQTAIDAYNAKVKVRDDAIDAYQAKVTAYNTKVVDLGALKDKHEKNCQDRRYDTRDLSDIKRGKK